VVSEIKEKEKKPMGGHGHGGMGSIGGMM